MPNTLVVIWPVTCDGRTHRRTECNPIVPETLLGSGDKYGHAHAVTSNEVTSFTSVNARYRAQMKSGIRWECHNRVRSDGQKFLCIYGSWTRSCVVSYGKL